MSDYKYNPWPIGKLPKEFQRPELDKLRESGYRFDDAREVVEIFEKKVAKFAGSNYAVAVDCCTHALELAFRYSKMMGEIRRGGMVAMPARTYISAYITPIKCGIATNLVAKEWTGLYQYGGSRVVDGAVRWTRDMYIKNTLHCLSFQIKKRVPIGRGGMILCNDKREYDWFKLASYDGRDLKTSYTDSKHLQFLGWHYYMTPEDAARGIILMDAIPEINEDTGGSYCYPDIREMINHLV